MGVRVPTRTAPEEFFIYKKLRGGRGAAEGEGAARCTHRFFDLAFTTRLALPLAFAVPLAFIFAKAASRTTKASSRATTLSISSRINRWSLEGGGREGD